MTEPRDNTPKVVQDCPRRLRVLSRACREGRIGFGETRAPVASWLGHARHADSLGLRRAVRWAFRC